MHEQNIKNGEKQNIEKGKQKNRCPQAINIVTLV